MPFSTDFDDIYQIGIKEACDAAGAYCERVDEQIFHESILERVYNQIAKADLLIADMTGRNPNVFYEVGYAHALSKRTILLTQNADDIPFDLKHFPHIVYGNRLVALRGDLKTRIEYFIKNPVEKISGSTIDIDLFSGKQNLSAGNAVGQFLASEVPNVKITVHNASAETFSPGDFKIGAITDSDFPKFHGKSVRTTPMPDGHFLHMLPDFEPLFPNAFASFHFILEHSHNSQFLAEIEIDVTFRVFTALGTRDYPITLRKVKRYY